MSDGRSRRWDGHRETRRAVFVEAAARAIEKHGPDAHLSDIAAEAGVSKPVLYRYFSDKDDLLGATAAYAADEIVTAVVEALRSDTDARTLVTSAVGAFLRQAELHRNLFLLAVRHHTRAVDGSVAGGKAAAAAVLTRTFEGALSAAGRDTRGAAPWAHAVVGLSISGAEWWLEQQTMTREEMTGYLSAFVWHAFDGISGGAYAGVTADISGSLTGSPDAPAPARSPRTAP